MSKINTIPLRKVVIRLWYVTNDLSFCHPWQDLFRNCVSLFKSYNIAPNYFRIYSEPKVIVMLMLEELIGALSQIPLLLRHLIAGSYTLFGAHDFKVSEHVIERKWCFSPLVIQPMRYRRKQFFTSVSVEMLIWLLYFYVISFLPVRSISATLSWLLLFAVEYVFNYSIWNVVPCAKMCHFFNSVVLQLSFSGKILYLK